MPHVLTGRIARNELNALDVEIRRLERVGSLVVDEVRAGSDVATRAKRLRQEGADGGEAEAIAWAALAGGEGVLFASLDGRARRHAQENRVRAADVFGVILEWLACDPDIEPVARAALSSWDEDPGRVGRPKDWGGFEATRAKRRGA